MKLIATQKFFKINFKFDLYPEPEPGLKTWALAPTKSCRSTGPGSSTLCYTFCVNGTLSQNLCLLISSIKPLGI
jgi:hypothetical protein